MLSLPCHDHLVNAGILLAVIRRKLIEEIIECYGLLFVLLMCHFRMELYDFLAVNPAAFDGVGMLVFSFFNHADN